jgi:hypothetical protein
MSINDSYLFDAGWLFFAFWTVIVGAVSITAFRRDLFPSRAPLELTDHHQPPNPSSSAETHSN